jgi:hypothetical protein
MPKSVSTTRPSGTDQDVRRLHVPVQDAFRVRGGQGAEDAEADLGGAGGRDRALLIQDLAQRLVGEELHDDARMTVFLHDVVDAYDVPVAEAAGDLGFPHGAAARYLPLLLGEMRGPDHLLHRHVPPEQLIVAPPDHAHAADADNRAKPVAPREQAVRYQAV